MGRQPQLQSEHAEATVQALGRGLPDRPTSRAASPRLNWHKETIEIVGLWAGKIASIGLGGALIALGILAAVGFHFSAIPSDATWWHLAGAGVAAISGPKFLAIIGKAMS